MTIKKRPLGRSERCFDCKHVLLQGPATQGGYAGVYCRAQSIQIFKSPVLAGIEIIKQVVCNKKCREKGYFESKGGKE